jgi:hypothetical protein
LIDPQYYEDGVSSTIPVYIVILTACYNNAAVFCIYARMTIV